MVQYYYKYIVIIIVPELLYIVIANIYIYIQ